jgi:hypothetical protein
VREDLSLLMLKYYSKNNLQISTMHYNYICRFDPYCGL